MSEARDQPGLRLGGRVSVPLTDKPVLQTGLTGRGLGGPALARRASLTPRGRRLASGRLGHARII